MAESLVVDASLAFHLLLPGPDHARLQDQATRWQTDGTSLFAPMLWLHEVTSALCRAVLLGSLTPSEGRTALSLANGMGVQLVPPDARQAVRAYEWTLRLQRAAAYDSFYLALAESMGSEFWTVDERLQRAVGQPWVRLA